ncbi:MAG: FGGY family carbohydrate kinase, partial [Candidatus Polarisedimenticolia bacterium]
MTAFLALDQGTSWSKAGVFDGAGRLLGRGRVPVRTRFGPGGRADQDPAAILASARRAIRIALEEAGRPSLAAAAVTSQRSTFVLWDRATGRPLGPAPTWQSTEAAAVCARLSRHAARVRRITGLPLSPHYSASKLARLLEAHPAWRRGGARGQILFGHVATFLMWHLSDGASHVVDPTQAARSLLFDLGASAWSPWLLDRFGVPAAMLPSVSPSLGPLGEMRLNGRAVPVTAMLGDQQAALVGAMGLSPSGAAGTAVVNYGTGAFILIPTGGRAVRRAGLLTSFAWTDARSKRHLLEGTVNAGGAVVDWMRDGLGLTIDGPSIDRVCRRGAPGAVMLASFWGPGSAGPEARGAGLPSVLMTPGGASPWAPADVARPAVESIAHAVAGCVSAAGGRVKRVVATGPLARSRFLMEMQSALLGVPVEVRSDEDATLSGIACAASGGAMPVRA